MRPAEADASSWRVRKDAPTAQSHSGNPSRLTRQPEAGVARRGCCEIKRSPSPHKLGRHQPKTADLAWPPL